MIKKDPLKIKEVKDVIIKIEYVDIDDLIPNDYNPNVHNQNTLNLLTRSIALFGFTQPIVVRRGTNEIIDGEHRYRVACILDIQRVPVVYVDMSDDEMKIATIMHNQARGKHSYLLTKTIKADLSDKGIDLSKELLEDL